MAVMGKIEDLSDIHALRLKKKKSTQSITLKVSDQALFSTFLIFATKWSTASCFCEKAVENYAEKLYQGMLKPEYKEK